MPATPSETAVLQQDTARLQRLIDAATDHAVTMLDPDGFIVGWNTGGQQITGYQAAEILGQHVSRLFTEEDRRRGRPADALKIARECGRHESEGWRVHKDGTRFWATTVTHAVRGDDGSILAYGEITRDFTERHQAHVALLESERRLRLLVEGVVDYAIYMLDPSGIVTHWNAGAERLKGYTAAEMVGQHFSRFYSREDQLAGVPAKVLDHASREGHYEGEGWRIRKDGSRFWASVAVDAIRGPGGELVGFAKVTRDITERKSAQEALRESERQLRLLINGVTEYALFMLDPNGLITNWNAGAQRITGYAAEEIVGQHFSRFYTEADRAAGVPFKALQAAAERGKYEAEGWRVRKDGNLFWASVVIEAIRDEKGALVGFAKITRDATDRRQAQAALQKAQQQLANAQKMEALGQLTGGIAHDFNNLLMIVSGHMHMLKKFVADHPRGRRAAEAIESAAKRGEALTRQLLTFSRRQRLSPTSIDLADRVGAVREMLSNSIGGGIRFVSTIPAHVWPVEVDVSEFELALVNIALNARDAMPEGGVITISAENVQLKPGDLDADLKGDFVALSIVDTGGGIPEDILPKIFDPFFTTKAADKGTGLGLSQVHGFAHQSGGMVSVTSEIGRGTRVTIYLPRASSHPRNLEAGDHQAPLEDVTGGSVLLVEDNPEVASASTALFEQLGFRVTVFANAQAALQALEQGECFDLVFSDVVMAGGMDGLALARALRERRPDLPVLLTTGYSEAVERARDEFPILRKPYQLGELGRVTARLIAEARRRARDSNLVQFVTANRRGAPRSGSR
jgi:PAS domain S-box-containing protein